MAKKEKDRQTNNSPQEKRKLKTRQHEPTKY